MLILIIILILVFGLGGGYYGHTRWGPGGGAREVVGVERDIRKPAPWVFPCPEEAELSYFLGCRSRWRLDEKRSSGGGWTYHRCWPDGKWKL